MLAKRNTPATILMRSGVCRVCTETYTPSIVKRSKVCSGSFVMIECLYGGLLCDLRLLRRFLLRVI